MKPTDLRVRCTARRDGAIWVALCLDFDLAAQADTLEEVKRKLHAQINCYVRDAFTVDRDHADELLARKAPLFQRIAFDIRYHLYPIAKRAGVAMKRMVYMDPLPMSVAPC